MEPETKNIVINFIKNVDIGDDLITNEIHKKWFRFGAYDALRNLTEKIKDYPDVEKNRTNVS